MNEQEEKILLVDHKGRLREWPKEGFDQYLTGVAHNDIYQINIFTIALDITYEAGAENDI